MNLKIWLEAFRLRTLPLSISTILVGSFLAYPSGEFNVLIFIAACTTTILLQILSNLSNDLGDFLKGTDNDNRIGPMRATQSGKISISQMKIAVISFSILAFLSGLTLLLLSFQKIDWSFFIFLGLGILAIAASIKYTMGKAAYGYMGLGDVFVFLFFGLVGVGGVYFLHVGSMDSFVFLPASAIGLLSAAVLNMNNMRDIENDKASGKITLVVKMGFKQAKLYHLMLIVLAWGLLLFFAFNRLELRQMIFLVSLPIFVFNSIKVWQSSNPLSLDQELRKLAIGTFILSLLFSTGIAIL